jgi:hypothetical protein
MWGFLKAAGGALMAAMRTITVDEITSDENGHVYSKQATLMELATRKILQAIITIVCWGLGSSPIRDDARTREVILRLNLAGEGL